jgi:hypothetical protein
MAAAAGADLIQLDGERWSFSVEMGLIAACISGIIPLPGTPDKYEKLCFLKGGVS